VDQAFYRAAKAAFFLELLTEAASYCQRGLEQYPNNEELKKQLIQIDLRKKEDENHKAQVSKTVAEAKVSYLVGTELSSAFVCNFLLKIDSDVTQELAFAIESRGLKLGKAMYQELTGVRKPVLDKSSILHWPVLLLYAEVMSSDFIEDFCETDVFAAHLDMISFSHVHYFYTDIICTKIIYHWYILRILEYP